MIKKLLSLCYLALVMAMSPYITKAQNFEPNILTQNFSGVIPNAYASTTGTTSFVGPLTNTARTYQRRQNRSNCYRGEAYLCLMFSGWTLGIHNALP